MRAKEIKEDPVMKNVYYQGRPVYIQSVDDDTHMVTIRFTKEEEDLHEVEVTDLVEEN
ncbi:H-type small acid-soluble spore protein [Pelagirhabdus alkalitolerans]|nr:H-type small acid-soluble spore protein [Pelagirhabdus alkalitolerans]